MRTHVWCCFVPKNDGGGPQNHALFYFSFRIMMWREKVLSIFQTRSEKNFKKIEANNQTKLLDTWAPWDRRLQFRIHLRYLPLEPPRKRNFEILAMWTMEKTEIFPVSLQKESNYIPMLSSSKCLITSSFEHCRLLSQWKHLGPDRASLATTPPRPAVQVPRLNVFPFNI